VRINQTPKSDFVLWEFLYLDKGVWDTGRVLAYEIHLCHVGKEVRHLPLGRGGGDGTMRPPRPPFMPTDLFSRPFGKLRGRYLKDMKGEGLAPCCACPPSEDPDHQVGAHHWRTFDHQQRSPLDLTMVKSFLLFLLLPLIFLPISDSLGT